MDSYHQMYEEVKTTFESKPRIEVDDEFYLHDLKDGENRFLVISAILSCGYASIFESENDEESSKRMGKVESKFCEEIFYKAIDKEDCKALSELGFSTLVGGGQILSQNYLKKALMSTVNIK